MRKVTRRPRGISSIEVLVSFTLLAAILGAATPLVVTHGRLLASHRENQWALEELSDQLDRLTTLNNEQRQQALQDLQPSPFASERLPGAQLTCKLTPIEFGERLTLQLIWNEPGRVSAPLTMSAWVFPGGAASKEEGRP
jgi:hypothetical protein